MTTIYKLKRIKFNPYLCCSIIAGLNAINYLSRSKYLLMSIWIIDIICCYVINTNKTINYNSSKNLWNYIICGISLIICALLFLLLDSSLSIVIIAPFYLTVFFWANYFSEV